MPYIKQTTTKQTQTQIMPAKASNPLSIVLFLLRVVTPWITPKIDKRRVVSEEEGLQWAKEHSCQYFETSASSGASVNIVFTKLFEMALDKMKTTTPDNNNKTSSK